MERFKKITAIDYDRVMVFPHAIAPVKTLGLLKRHGFLSTVNAGNVPPGADAQAGCGSNLHFEPPLFENFVSLDRWAAEHANKDMVGRAVARGRPLLFYTHHDFFKAGIHCFNRIAKMVNAIETNVEWKSLGYISRHLYLLRKRDDGNYDVRAFCKTIEIENALQHDVTYYIKKKETLIPSISKVTVDGKPHAYQVVDGDLSIQLAIPGGESRLIDIVYENDLDSNLIDISKKDPHINRLRKLSDFRDLVLSKNMAGRAVIEIYYETGMHRLGLRRLAVYTVFILMVAGVASLYAARLFTKRRHQASQT
jgi:hypothetical protein